MPLKVIRNPETKATEVVFIADKKPVAIGVRVEPRPKMSHEIDYDMHRWQEIFVPAQTKLKPRATGAT